MIKKIVQKILLAEKNNNLFDFTFKGYSVWSYYRMYFYYALTKDLGILDNSVSGFKKDFNYLKKNLSIFKFKKLLGKKEIFVLEHPRSNKEGIDIYTADIVEFFGKKKCSFFSFSQNGIVNKKDNVIILDLVKILSKIFSKFFYTFVKNSYFESFKKMLKELEPLEEKKYIKQYKRYYLELVFQYYFFYFLLKIKKSKKVILTVSYYNMPLVFAAKNLKIEVIEMQHGVISNYHLGYHYPFYKTNFFPDKLCIFSDFWKKSALFPKNCEIITSGNSYLYKNINEEIKKVKNTILVISQATIGIKLAEYILKNIEFLKDYNIYFKLHPNEFNNFEDKYYFLLNYANIKLVTNEYSVHQLQDFCEYQIGIYSTAIYEGIERRCKTLLLNEIGIEYMEQLISSELAFKVDFQDSLINVLKKVKVPRKIKFFDKFELKDI